MPRAAPDPPARVFDQLVDAPDVRAHRVERAYFKRALEFLLRHAVAARTLYQVEDRSLEGRKAHVKAHLGHRLLAVRAHDARMPELPGADVAVGRVFHPNQCQTRAMTMTASASMRRAT